MRYYLLFWLSYQIPHLLVDGRVEDAALAARNVPGDVEPSTSPWTKIGEHYFELSSCSFSDADSQLDYFCYDPDGVYVENPDKLNTLKISEYLCDHGHGLCRNVSLFLFKSQVAGLCISSSTRDLLQEFVGFAYDGYFRYSPICIVPDSKLQHIQYAGGFSCTSLHWGCRNLKLVITGYDLLNSGVWWTPFTIKIVGNCSLTPRYDSDFSTAHEVPLAWPVIVQAVIVLVILVVQTTVFARKIFKFRQLKSKKTHETGLFLMQNRTGKTPHETILSDSIESNTSDLAMNINFTNSELQQDQQEAVTVVEIHPWLNTNSVCCDLQQIDSTSNMATSDTTVSTGTATQEVDVPVHLTFNIVYYS